MQRKTDPYTLVHTDHAHRPRPVRRSASGAGRDAGRRARGGAGAGSVERARVRRVRGVALMIAVVGVAGVLAFSVSARTREFGIRLAIGSEPKALLGRVLKEGATIAGIGIVAGGVGGFLLARAIAAYINDVSLPGVVPTLGAALVLVAAALLASLMPAARASRVDVIDALRPE